MPRGQEPRWRKIYKGRTYYFRGEYREALKAWQRLQVSLDGYGDAYGTAIANRRAMADWRRRPRDTPYRQAAPPSWPPCPPWKPWRRNFGPPRCGRDGRRNRAVERAAG